MKTAPKIIRKILPALRAPSRWLETQFHPSEKELLLSSTLSELSLSADKEQHLS